MQLQDKWSSFFERANAKGNPDYFFQKIKEAYSIPERHYHTLDWHIANSIQELETARHLAENPLELEFALWTHDIIYDTKRTDNEEKSAEFARNMAYEMGLSEEFGNKVASIIIPTKYIIIPEDIDSKLMLDIDLSMLGKPDPDFRIDKAIKQEYSWVPEEIRREHRINILNRFLSQRIYLTDFFYQKYETQARYNLEKSIAMLKSQESL